ncbi:hypothetical protein LUZ60_015455 [Juncus effusus]|nr:hypothetical protein LUZ60_015455 [Juncus effusus]
MGLHSTSPRFYNPISRRIFSDVSGDITIYVNNQPFLLHKFPLMAKCGRIRRFITESHNPDLSKLELQNVTGGSSAFELAVKFCYNSNFEITTSNISHLYCIAHYLEMSEEFSEENLISQTEIFLNEIVFKSLEKTLQVLNRLENLNPLAEETGLVERCIDSIALNVSKEQLVTGLTRLERDSGSTRYPDWWIEDISKLKIEYYKRVIGSMRRMGVRPDSIINSIMHYAQASLKGIIEKQELNNFYESGPLVGEKQRVILETLVNLLSTEKISLIPLSFLFGMLRMGIELDAGFDTRLELEKCIGLQLENASLDDLLIPSFHSSDSVFDTDTIHRILVKFLQRVEEEEEFSGYESEGFSGAVDNGSVLKVGRLMDGYLAEIAPDPCLKLQKFMTLIELLPDYARVVDDGLYRAIDIYIKAHPSLTESECTKLCKLIDCQKLSQDASNHAAQNDRLPVQISVRILYFEQLRLKSSLISNDTSYSHRIIPTSGAPSAAVSPRDNYACLRRENRELKLEISRMRVRISELEKEQAVIKQGMKFGKENGRAFLGYISRGLVRMTSFGPGVVKEKGVEKDDRRGGSERKNRRRHK